MKKITVQEVASTLESEIESSEPDAIFEVLKKHDGKQFTKRILAHLPGGADRWSIRVIAGMTQLVDRTYMQKEGGAGFSFLISYATVNVMIDCAKILKQNACYFEARVERNAKRQAALKDLVTLNKMAIALNAMLEARAALASAEAQLQSLTSYGEVFSPDSFTWRTMGGEPRRS
jgi:hypothetical protein